MLVLFLRTFKYIFLYFFSLNNKCMRKCTWHSFSTQHSLSAVDGWLNTPRLPLHPPFRSTTDSPIRLQISQISPLPPAYRYPRRMHSTTPSVNTLAQRSSINGTITALWIILLGVSLVLSFCFVHICTYSSKGT